MPRCLFPLTLLAVFLLPPLGRVAAAEPDLVESDTELLSSAGVHTDGPALLDYFKKRVVNDVDRQRIAKLINDLASEDFDTREKASQELTSIGAPARLQLREAQKSADVEVSRRAEQCMAQIDKVASAPFLCAAARLVAHHKPDGATEVLLAFLPSAEEASVIDEVVATLKVVGFKDGKAVPALVKALADNNSLRRAAAADALWRGGDAEQRKEVRKLLADPDVQVRLRLALALYDTKDKTCVPALIDLLVDAPRDSAWRVENMLYTIAGDKAPQGTLTGTDAARKKYREQWEAWWKEHGKDIDLAKIEEPYLGFTLLTEMNITGTLGRVVELDQTGKTRWQLENLRYPIDAQVLRGDKVLVAEYTGRAVTERNLKNEVLWTKNVNSVLIGARRLSNGNTFIVTRQQLLEVDRDGKEVTTINRNDIASAQKLRNGNIGIITTTGQYVRLDTAGKELKSFPVGLVYTIGAHFTVLPNGHLIVPQYSASRVVEFDGDGKEIWTATVAQPTCVTRLPNGNTLVGSRFTRAIVELDRTGKEVSKTMADGRPTQIERR